MLLLLVLPVLIAGYIVVTKHPEYYIKLHRYDGQLLYLVSATQGFYSTIPAVVLVTVLSSLPCHIVPFGEIPCSRDLQSAISPIGKSGEFAWGLAVSVVAIGISLVRAKILFPLRAFIRYRLLDVGRARKTKTSSRKLAMLKLLREMIKENPLDILLFDAFLNRDFVMLTMDDGKVYVGTVVALGEPCEHEGMDQEICIEPIRSGYRKTEVKKVIFTTDYRKVTTNAAVVLRQDNIISATIYDEQIYSDFQKTHQKSDSFDGGEDTKPSS